MKSISHARNAFLQGQDSWNSYTSLYGGSVVVKEADVDAKLSLAGYSATELTLVDCAFEELDFSESRINKVKIEHCKFTNLTFDSSALLRKIEIRESEILGDISINAKHIEDVSLSKTQIGLPAQPTDNGMTHIKGNFFALHNCSNLRIEECDLYNQIYLSGVIDQVIISSSKFKNGIAFTNAETRTAHIVHSEFLHEINFWNLACSNLLHINEARLCNFNFSCKPQTVPSVNEVHITNSQFQGPSNFNNRRFGSTCDFSGSTFHMAPKFHNCEIHQDTNFAQANFIDFKSRGAEQAYRTLKLFMNKHHAHSEEMRFFALEMKARRHAEPNFTAWLYWIYEISSYYGQSITRPLLGLCGTFCTFGLAYRFAKYGSDPIQDWASISKLLAFTLNRTFLPFVPSLSKNEPFTLDAVDELSAALLIGIHSILSLALLFLLALGLRNRFRLKN